MQSPAAIRVELGTRSYEIRVGAGNLSALGRWLEPLARGPRVALLTDPAVDALYGEAARASLASSGFSVATVIVPEGEEHKSLAGLARVYERLAEVGVERTSTLIALGGGVIGDLSGFAAATYLRGIDFVQVPTTLLAQVDSAIGGKTGVNLRVGKNLVGAVHQPRLVVADVDLLRSLPRRELVGGMAEVVKYGVILSPSLFAYLEENRDLLDALDRDALTYVVRECAALKAKVVAEDEHESGLRAILNFGHTLGHALEAATEYRSYVHGEAVAIGLAFAVGVSVRRHGFPPTLANRVIRLLESLGLPTCLPAEIRPEALVRAMATDKKKDQDRVKFIGVEDLGRTRFEVLSLGELEEALRAA
jgi:3-dehydroquinate synthase